MLTTRRHHHPPPAPPKPKPAGRPQRRLNQQEPWSAQRQCQGQAWVNPNLNICDCAGKQLLAEGHLVKHQRSINAVKASSQGRSIGCLMSQHSHPGLADVIWCFQPCRWDLTEFVFRLFENCCYGTKVANKWPENRSWCFRKTKLKPVWRWSAPISTSTSVTSMEPGTTTRNQELGPYFILFCVNSANRRKIHKVLPAADVESTTT